METEHWRRRRRRLMRPRKWVAALLLSLSLLPFSGSEDQEVQQLKNEELLQQLPRLPAALINPASSSQSGFLSLRHWFEGGARLESLAEQPNNLDTDRSGLSRSAAQPLSAQPQSNGGSGELGSGLRKVRALAELKRRTEQRNHQKSQHKPDSYGCLLSHAQRRVELLKEGQEAQLNGTYADMGADIVACRTEQRVWAERGAELSQNLTALGHSERMWRRIADGLRRQHRDQELKNPQLREHRAEEEADPQLLKISFKAEANALANLRSLSSRLLREEERYNRLKMKERNQWIKCEILEWSLVKSRKTEAFQISPFKRLLMQLAEVMEAIPKVASVVRRNELKLPPISCQPLAIGFNSDDSRRAAGGGIKTEEAEKVWLVLGLEGVRRVVEKASIRLYSRLKTAEADTISLTLRLNTLLSRQREVEREVYQWLGHIETRRRKVEQLQKELQLLEDAAREASSTSKRLLLVSSAPGISAEEANLYNIQVEKAQKLSSEASSAVGSLKEKLILPQKDLLKAQSTLAALREKEGLIHSGTKEIENELERRKDEVGWLRAEAGTVAKHSRMLLTISESLSSMELLSEYAPAFP